MPFHVLHLVGSSDRYCITNKNWRLARSSQDEANKSIQVRGSHLVDRHNHRSVDNNVLTCCDILQGEQVYKYKQLVHIMSIPNSQTYSMP